MEFCRKQTPETNPLCGFTTILPPAWIATWNFALGKTPEANPLCGFAAILPPAWIAVWDFAQAKLQK
jgi:hypothetical protein